MPSKFPSWYGMAATLAAIDAAAGQIESRSFREASQAVQAAGARARQLVPVDTGYLRSTIQTEAEQFPGGWQVSLHAGAFYAGYVEFGTVNAPSQPYLRPAFQEMVDTLGAG